MKLSKISAALALAGVALASSVAFAAPSITNKDGTLMPFGGFDWASGGAAFSNDFSATVGSTFTFTYASWAANVACSSGSSCTNLLTPNLDTNANGTGPATSYEYTTYQTLIGTVDSVNATGTIIEYTITGGSWNIYYDTSPDAFAQANGAWTGFIDGVSILSGVWQSSPGIYATALPTNSIGLDGMVTATNNAYVSPDMDGTILSSTLQLFGFDDTSFNPPTSIEGIAILSNEEGGNLFEADANQTFAPVPVPEPASLLLTALALVGLGITTRRRRS